MDYFQANMLTLLVMCVATIVGLLTVLLVRKVTK